ncbi:PIR Superfamily Protein [Plasmodium ovale curtisi]|uniref:PIR Superfamily Protein n=1 Tax=Plasmodium ovale curtisi TaxID=864141 RepID=A0A1A8X9W6_PLAOA|nr:PIR Superfamily Protein [Plasmodium ovale curtisi]
MGKCELELTSLDSFFEYSKFDIPETPSDRSGHCDSELSELYTNDNFQSFCYKFTRNFTNIIIKWVRNSKYSSDNCEYLNYWTYSELIKNHFNVDKDDLSNSKIINDMTKLWKNYSDHFPQCELKNYKMSTEHFQYMKQLYDYSKDYSRIKENHCLDNLQCKPCYCIHIKKVISVFKLVQQECQSPRDNELCSLYNSIEGTKNPENLLNHMQCPNEDEDGFAAGPNGEDDLGSSLEGSPFRAGLNAGLSILGISVISFFLMYKFTPLQSWLNTVTRRLNRNKYFVGKEETNEMLSYNSETEDTNLSNNELNVSYNPLLNF